jgi:DNA-binding NtrC family response regulator
MLKILSALNDLPGDIAGVLEDHDLATIKKGEDLHGLVSRNNYNLVLIEGHPRALPQVKALDPRAEVILIGDDERDALEAVKLGASAYFKKPVDKDRFKGVIDAIVVEFETRRETAELENRLIDNYTYAGVVGRNPLMLDIFAFIRRIAPYFKTVTITGETGTGKEVIARALHASSPHGDEPFLACNCASLVESLAESELFGHKKGAFTGAVSDRKGLFEVAGRGTIFLDEIGDLPPSLQPHLLRVLENGEFRAVGSSQPLKAECQVIAATNRELAEEVKSGRFREDLFYRLTPLTMHLPPLRDRKDDIHLLCKSFLSRFRERTEKKIFGISRPAQGVLMTYDWPGNVRELENVLEQAAIMATESFIRPSDLPPSLTEPGREKSLPSRSLDETIRTHILAALKECDGNKTRAAKLLGISRRALIRKIEKYFIK